MGAVSIDCENSTRKLVELNNSVVFIKSMSLAFHLLMLNVGDDVITVLSSKFICRKKISIKQFFLKIMLT